MLLAQKGGHAAELGQFHFALEGGGARVMSYGPGNVAGALSDIVATHGSIVAGGKVGAGRPNRGGLLGNGPPQGGGHPTVDRHHLSPTLSSVLFPMKCTTWNAASLLGGLRTLRHQWHRKRSAMQTLLGLSGIVCVQEVRSLNADLQFLPNSRQYIHSMMTASVDGYIFREGGFLITLRRGLEQTLTQVARAVVHRGWILALHMERCDDVLHGAH